MRIALVHDAVIPPRRYGGTERVIANLASGLIIQGHRVTLIARAGSYLPEAELRVPRDFSNAEVQAALASDIEIAHFSATPSTEMQRWLQERNIALLVTIHGNGQPGETFHPNTVFLSQSHAANHHSTHFVYNGIDIANYPCDSQREPRLVFLAKASWGIKNLTGAIAIAKAAQLPLDVLGSRSWPGNLQRYLPRRSGVRYCGMVDEVEKIQLIRNAKALLFPVRWPEPFGLAITECLASGCRVYGTTHGSLPEIVSPTVGHLSLKASDIVHAIRSEADTPELCRSHVAEHFSQERMVSGYLDYYKKILREGLLVPWNQAPRARFTERADRNLLSFL